GFVSSFKQASADARSLQEFERAAPDGKSLGFVAPRRRFVDDAHCNLVARASSIAVVSPTGPAPTTSTSVFIRFSRGTNYSCSRRARQLDDGVETGGDSCKVLTLTATRRALG